jgi:hypothetical protein
MAGLARLRMTTFHRIFSTERMLQIVTILGATVVMKCSASALVVSAARFHFRDLRVTRRKDGMSFRCLAAHFFERCSSIDQFKPDTVRIKEIDRVEPLVVDDP